MLKKQQEMFPLAVAADPDAKWADLCADALIRSKNDRAENTTKTYWIQWEQWKAWCEHYEASILPVDPAAFVSHLEWMAQRKCQRSTIRLRLTAISLIDAWGRVTPATPHPATLASHPAVKRWWKAYVRSSPSRKNQSPFVSREDIASILNRMMDKRITPSRTLHWARDRAVILVAYLGAFRRSELADLTIGQVERCDRGMWVRWAHSKGDQEGLGEERLILHQEEVELCAVDAWDRWMEQYALYAPIDPARAAFPPVVGTRILNKHMRETTLYDMIARHATHAKIACTPHSLRAAFATHSLEAHDATEVAFHGRWSSTQTMQPYIRRTRSWTKNATGRLSRLDKSRTKK